MEDYERALDYCQQALRGYEKVLGKTHPETLMTVTNIGSMFMDGLKDFSKGEEMTRLALNGYEKSLGKDYNDTKACARNLNVFLEEMGRLAEKTALEEIYPESGL